MVQRSYKNFVFRFCFVIVSSPPFNIIILVLILANTYILADYRFDESLKEAELKARFDNFFVAAFTIEFILKLVGLGFTRYFHDQFNIFDAIVVFISLTEVILAELPSDVISDQTLQILLVLKASRSIRLLKLARYNQGMRRLLF